MSLFSRCLKIRKIQVRWFCKVCTQMKKTTTSNRNLQHFLAKDDAAETFELSYRLLTDTLSPLSPV